MAHNIAREPGMREGTFFYHIGNGYYFHESDQRHGTIYYKCVRAGRSCRGRASYDPTEGFVLTGHHNHGPDAHYGDEMALRRNILARCANLEYASLQNIILEESLRFPPEVARRVTYARMRTPMRNARLQRYPPPPETLRDLTEILQDPRYSVISLSQDGQDNIYGGSVDDADGEHHILFISQRMVEKCREFSVLHADGTFKSVPVGLHFAAQVFCIVAEWDHTIIPLAWSLMSRKTENAYTAVLSLLLHLMGNEFDLERVITDFEAAEQNAWRNTFDVHVQGCYWHLCRDYIRMVARLNLIRHMRGIAEVRYIIKETMAIPLLPEQYIRMGYLIILQKASREGRYIFRLVKPFLQYVWTNWVRRPVVRRRMCVYGSEQRTNNCSESGNKSLNDEVGNHSSVFRFLEGLTKLEQRSHNNLLGLEEGRRVGRARRVSSYFNDARIKRLGDQLMRPHGNIRAAVARFLRRAAHLVDNVVENFVLGHEQQAARRENRH